MYVQEAGISTDSPTMQAIVGQCDIVDYVCAAHPHEEAAEAEDQRQQNREVKEPPLHDRASLPPPPALQKGTGRDATILASRERGMVCCGCPTMAAAAEGKVT